MDKLYAFGCSLTYGHGLKDCWNRRTRTVGDNPSKYAWPQLLANKLGRECINLSMPGASNKEILYTLEKTIDQISTNDVVYIKWSYTDRHSMIQPNGHITHVKQGTKLWQRWVKHYYTEEDGIWLTQTFIDFATLILNKNKIKHFHLTTDHSYLDKINCRYAKFLKDGSIWPLRKKFAPALDNSHPGEEAHIEFANIVYEQTISVTGEHNET